MASPKKGQRERPKECRVRATIYCDPDLLEQARETGHMSQAIEEGLRLYFQGQKKKKRG